LWLGHLSKQTTEDDVAAEISKYGQIESINVSMGPEVEKN